MASESASARSSNPNVKFLDSKQAYVRAMNADGLAIIEGTGKPSLSIPFSQLTEGKKI